MATASACLITYQQVEHLQKMGRYSPLIRPGPGPCSLIPMALANTQAATWWPLAHIMGIFSAFECLQTWKDRRGMGCACQNSQDVYSIFVRHLYVSPCDKYRIAMISGVISAIIVALSLDYSRPWSSNWRWPRHHSSLSSFVGGNGLALHACAFSLAYRWSLGEGCEFFHVNFHF